MSDRHILPMPFIVGVPRSGTTLLGVMLGSHPDLVISPKGVSIAHLVAACRVSSTPHATFVQVATSSDTSPSWRDWHIHKASLQDSVNAIQPFDLRLALHAMYRLLAQRAEKPRYGDKTIENLAVMDTIQQVLPEAHFIHIVRDGRAQWLSERQTAWGTQLVSSGALRWAQKIRRARHTGRTLKAYLEIRFEDLVTAPKATLEQVAKFIKLPWNDSMLNYSDHAASLLAGRQDSAGLSADYRRQLHVNITKAPDVNRIDAWKTALTSTEIHQFEHYAGDILLACGYELSSAANPALCRFYRLAERAKRRMARKW